MDVADGRGSATTAAHPSAGQEVPARAGRARFVALIQAIGRC